MRRRALALLAASVVLAASGDARADLYRWVDDTGEVHYATDRDAIPSAYRDAAQEILKPPARRVVRRPSAAAPARVPPLPAPDTEPSAPAPTAPPATPALAAPPLVTPAPLPPAVPGAARPLPGPPGAPELPPGDPRAAEAAELEAQIAHDRETLRQMISTPRWDSSELANDPQIREIAERLPRLQAELDALRKEPAP